MPEGGMTKTLDLILSGKSRQSLKVTTNKEVVRLLMKSPSDDNLKLVLRELRRKELHRDVRIAILQSSLRLLRNDRLCQVAWKV